MIKKDDRLGKIYKPIRKPLLMTKGVPRKSNLAVKQMIEQIFSAKQISRYDHLKLISAVLSDYDLTDEDRRQINRIFDYIQTGRLKIVD